MGPHVTSNVCKADKRESRIETTDKTLNILLQRASRSGLADLTVCLSSPTVSCTTPVQQEVSVKIDKLIETRTYRRRRQRGSARLYGEGEGGGSIRTEAIGKVSSSANAEPDILEKPPNAVRCDTMAPALTEPLSPTEKLSSSTAKATLSTRSGKRASEPTVTTGSSVSSVSNNTVGGREKRNRNTSTSSSSSSAPIPSTSTRVTRSKDVYQRVLEQSVSPISTTPPPDSTDIVAVAATTTTKSTSPSPGGPSSAGPGNIEPTKCTPTNNEPMGLSAALHNNNNNNNRNNNSKGIDDIEAQLSATSSACEIPPKGKTINNIINTNSKSNSTEQLLADLTDDFEEAITAEICLRKQLKESNLSKDAASNTTSATATSVSQPKDIFVIKASDSVASEISQAQLQHMESSQSSCGKEDDNTTLTTQTPSTTTSTVRIAVKAIQESHKEQSSDGATEPALSSKTVTSPIDTITSTQQNEAAAAVAAVAAMMVSPPMSTEHLHTVEGIELAAQVSQKQDTSRLHILSVEELPPISTDSTMTASEVEDNLEERLSQLDGTAIVSPACEEPSTAAVIGTIPATPPRTPTKQHLQQLHQQQVQQLQQQLQQTPPTPLSQQVHQHQLAQHSFTPQSSSSSINTLSSTNLPPAFMKETAASELEDQDIEEVLKALKGLDGTAGADTLCDLNVLFNEVYTLNYEEVSSQPASTSNKPNPLKDMQCEIERKQQSVQRKIDFLLRRLRKMQARYMSKHTSEEIAGLFEWSARMVAGKVGTTSSGISIHGEQGTMTPLGENVNVAARPPAISWAEEKKNPVPSSQMVAMLRRLETVSNAQQLCTAVVVTNTVHTNTQLRKSKKALLEMHATSSTSTAMGLSQFSSSTDRKSETVVNTFDVKVAEEITHVAGLLQTEMREVQNAIDSDATESSSGGESADEMVTYNNSAQQPLSIAKRATWRYSRDRAAIASRWAWLLSQIADLEIRIRQHGELHQEILRTKGPVVCGLEEQFLSGLTKSNEGAAVATSSVNGYKGSMNMIAGSGMFKNELGSDETGLPGSCRTRGYMPSQFRKRKLFQTTNIHTFSKKAARTSTIKCGCQWPLQPCALCTGRSDPTAPRDPPDTMMMADRVALLDPGYHPVLSFPEDINNALHLEAIARMPEWQQRVMRCQVKSIAKSVWKAEREAAAAAGHHTSKKYGGEHIVKRRYIKKKVAEDKNAAPVNTASNTPLSTTATAGGTFSTTTTNTTATTLADGATTSSQTTPTPMATTSSDAGNGTGILSTSTTPLVANSKLLVEKCKEVALSPGGGRRIAGATAVTGGDQSQWTQSKQSPQYQQRQQQLHPSNERLSPTKLRSIQSQPGTFIIDLQQQQ